MNAELIYLAAITLVTALMWIPYVLNMIMVRGLKDALGYPEDPKSLTPWAHKMKNAHANAVENLVVFAVLILVAHALGISNDATVLASIVYFWARVAHFVVYTLAVPVVRTLSFTVGFACQAVIAVQILA